MLDAAGIPAGIVERGRGCLLVVRDEDRSRAVRELEDYRREALEQPPERQLKALPGGWIGMLAYWAALITVAGAGGRPGLRRRLVRRGPRPRRRDDRR